MLEQTQFPPGAGGYSPTVKAKITAQDLILYIGLPCAIYDLLPNGEINKNVVAPAYIEGVDVNQNKVIAERVNYEPIQIKPILKRLEDFTIEDSVFISEVMEYDKAENESEKMQWHHNDLNDIREFGFIQFDTSDSIFIPKIIEYLIRKGYNLHLLPHGTYLLQNKNGIATED
jgi:hypothetical protein